MLILAFLCSSGDFPCLKSNYVKPPEHKKHIRGHIWAILLKFQYMPRCTIGLIGLLQDVGLCTIFLYSIKANIK